MTSSAPPPASHDTAQDPGPEPSASRRRHDRLTLRCPVRVQCMPSATGPASAHASAHVSAHSSAHSSAPPSTHAPPHAPTQALIEREGTVQDLSPQGLSLFTARPIEPGSRCTLRFVLPLPQGPRAVALAAKAVYSSYTGPGVFRIGMLFMALTGEERDAIRAMLA